VTAAVPKGGVWVVAKRARMSSGHVVMLGAGALGVLLTLSVLRGADATHPVLLVAHDVAAGTTIADTDLRLAHVRASGAVLADVFAARDRAQVRGRVFATTMHAGALLTRATVRPVDVQTTTRVMSFPLPRAYAVGGKIGSGDRVDVVAVTRDDKRASYVLTDAEVVGVDTKGSGPLAGSSDDVTVSLVVDEQSAPRLAAALEAGPVTLVRHG
jgi:Flp pilus assembly protein CpaB